MTLQKNNYYTSIESIKKEEKRKYNPSNLIEIKSDLKSLFKTSIDINLYFIDDELSVFTFGSEPDFKKVDSIINH